MSALLAAAWPRARDRVLRGSGNCCPFPGSNRCWNPGSTTKCFSPTTLDRVSAAAVAYTPDDDADAGIASEDVPEPVANFVVAPLSPSTDDTVQPYDFSFDPARGDRGGWDFGDSSTSTEACPPHSFEADGQYVVTLRVTTQDRRSNTATRLVRVMTHDVAIAGIDAPSRPAGRRRRGAVASAHYPEMVQSSSYAASMAAPSSGSTCSPSRSLRRRRSSSASVMR